MRVERDYTKYDVLKYTLDNGNTGEFIPSKTPNPDGVNFNGLNCPNLAVFERELSYEVVERHDYPNFHNSDKVITLGDKWVGGYYYRFRLYMGGYVNNTHHKVRFLFEGESESLSLDECFSRGYIHPNVLTWSYNHTKYPIADKEFIYTGEKSSAVMNYPIHTIIFKPLVSLKEIHYRVDVGGFFNNTSTDWVDLSKTNATTITFTGDTAGEPPVENSLSSKPIRYIRDWCFGSTVNSGNHWVEIKAINFKGENVALNKKSKLTHPSSASNNAHYAVDGLINNSNYASAGSYGGKRGIVIDLGEPILLREIHLYRYSADSRKYKNTRTEVSTDGINWYIVYDSDVSGEYSEQIGGKWFDLRYMVAKKAEKTLESLNIRYIRDFINGSTANAGNHWVEIEAFTSEGVNVALNKEVTPMSGLTGGTTYPLSNITNGDKNYAQYGEVFNSNYKRAYIDIDLETPTKLEAITVLHYYNGGRSYYDTETWVSEDGERWYVLFDSHKQGEYSEESSSRVYSLGAIPLVDTETLERNLIDFNDNIKIKHLSGGGFKVQDGELLFDYNTTSQNVITFEDADFGQRIYMEADFIYEKAYSTAKNHFGIFLVANNSQHTGYRISFYNEYLAISLWRRGSEKMLYNQPQNFIITEGDNVKITAMFDCINNKGRVIINDYEIKLDWEHILAECEFSKLKPGLFGYGCKYKVANLYYRNFFFPKVPLDTQGKIQTFFMKDYYTDVLIASDRQYYLIDDTKVGEGFTFSVKKDIYLSEGMKTFTFDYINEKWTSVDATNIIERPLLSLSGLHIRDLNGEEFISGVNTVGDLEDAKDVCNRYNALYHLQTQEYTHLISSEKPLYLSVKEQLIEWSTSPQQVEQDYKIFKYIGSAWVEEHYYKDGAFIYEDAEKIQADCNILLPSGEWFYYSGNSTEGLTPVPAEIKKRFFIQYVDDKNIETLVTSSNRISIDENWIFRIENSSSSKGEYEVYQFTEGEWILKLVDFLTVSNTKFFPNRAGCNLILITPREYVFIQETEAVPQDIVKKFLIVDGNNIYNSNGTEYVKIGETPITQDHFIYQGMDEIPKHTTDVLSHLAKLHYYTEKRDTSEHRDITINAVPKMQRISKKVGLPSYGSGQIEKVKAYSNEMSGGVVYYALSFDGGKTYNTIQNDEWVAIDINNDIEIRNKALTTQTISNITKQVFDKIHLESLNMMVFLDRETMGSVSEARQVHFFYSVVEGKQ